ncbi:proteasome inhibitor PI31 subunit [Drosophila teissieri]|uniref:proteasome inhibitor PI31 subunit n=1 Tax=Drosophila teissieri TaxID=7243 RepID=UPI001CB9FFE1|nr:proteasome inhibitor PI31 subunit [Drosophila teissieri]
MEAPVSTLLSDLSELSLQSLGIGVAGRGRARREIDAYDWQLLLNSIRPSIRKKADLLIAVTHWLLTKEYRLRGATQLASYPVSGGRQVAGGCGAVCELLPDHWNREADRYTLNYTDELGGQYVLMAKLSHRRDLVISLRNSTSKRMAIACVQPEHLVRSTCKSSMDKCIPRLEQFMKRLRVELVDPAVRGTSSCNRKTWKKELPVWQSATSRVTFNLVQSTHALECEEST